jgi:phage tail-like protein
VADDTRSEGAGAGAFVTFAGGGFGTIQIERAIGSDPAPRPVSTPGYLRGHLPAIYADGDFGMRLVSALEAVLDPLVAILDNLPEHFDVAYAPRDVLELLTDWFALERDELRSGEERRRIVQRAPELMRLRGTRAGLELALETAFPGVPFRIEDAGEVTWALEPDGRAPEPDGDWKVAPESFVIYCDMPLPENRLAAAARLIDQAKPAHISYRLRVRAAKSDEGGGS